ncbi:MAG: protein translocase SEC61 complex subunit gamma [Candidatus Bathyarchaeia archaeon]
MGLSSFLKSCSRLLKLSKKPGRSELWLSIRICLLGVLLIGLIGFIIRIILQFTLAIPGGQGA